MAVTPEKLKNLLAQIKQQKGLSKEERSRIDALSSRIDTVSHVETDNLHGKDAPADLVEDTVKEILEETVKKPSQDEASQAVAVASPASSTQRVLGVTRDIVLNEKQQLFNDTVLQGKSCILIGAAGTGKTTSMRTVSRNLIDANMLPKLQNGTKHLVAGQLGIAIVAFTRKAVNNIKAAVVPELRRHVITVHKLLEFEPEFYDKEDKETGLIKTTVRFIPMRGERNPLPPELVALVMEESSMLGVDLYDQVQDAMPHQHQEIFLGDIQQLPPVFGRAILGFKLLELPVIELTEVYRQARESPIIDLAWKLLEGRKEVFDPKIVREKREIGGKMHNVVTVPSLNALSRETDSGTLHFAVWQTNLNPDTACIAFVGKMRQLMEEGVYNPEEDMILTPFNKAFGTVELNKGIANFLGKKRNAVVHEVIANRERHYLAVGDRVLYDKEDAYILDIKPNPNYLGKPPAIPSVHMDRWGALQQDMSEEELQRAHKEQEATEAAAIDRLLNGSLLDDGEQAARAASHIVTIKYAYAIDSENQVLHLSATGEINALLGGYALTVHKSQGSEWDRVFFVMHHSQAVMCRRELLYTAVTRAKKYLMILAENNTFHKGIQSQDVPGNTWEEKSRVFKAELAQRKVHLRTRKHTLGMSPITQEQIQREKKEELARQEETRKQEQLARAQAAVAKLREASRSESGGESEAVNTASATASTPAAVRAESSTQMSSDDLRRKAMLEKLLKLKRGR